MTCCILYHLKVLSVKLGGVICSDSKYPFIYLELDNISRYGFKVLLMC